MSNTSSVRILPTDNTNSYREMSEAVRNSILNDILDSEIAHPKQSDSERASETARIARRRKVTNLQVAGVRANLTRGAYGAKASLVRGRKQAVSA